MRFLLLVALALVVIAVVGRLVFTGNVGFGRTDLLTFSRAFFLDDIDPEAPLVLKPNLPRARTWSGKLLLIGRGHLGTRVLAQQSKLPDSVRATLPSDTTAVVFVDLRELKKEGSSNGSLLWVRTGWSLEVFTCDWKKKALVAQTTLQRYGPEKEASAIEKSLPDIYAYVKRWKAP